MRTNLLPLLALFALALLLFWLFSSQIATVFPAIDRGMW